MHSLCILLLLAACSAQSEPFSESDKIVVRFSLSGIQAEVSTRAGGNDTSPLAEGTTLRILAFKRVSTDADLSKDKYMGEGRYIANSDGSLTEKSFLLLPRGTYDFYALTPQEVSRVNVSDGNPCTVSVKHGDDYASSLTTATITEDRSSVSLAVLTRHCSKLVFNFLPKYDNITSVDIHSVQLTNMSKSPIVGSLNVSLPIEDGNSGTIITLSDFTPVVGKSLELSASTVVLPRQAGPSEFKMEACFNGSATRIVCSAPLPFADLGFQPGYQYIFTVKMKGDAAELELAVEPWGKEHSLDMDMGG